MIRISIILVAFSSLAMLGLGSCHAGVTAAPDSTGSAPVVSQATDNATARQTKASAGQAAQSGAFLPAQAAVRKDANPPAPPILDLADEAIQGGVLLGTAKNIAQLMLDGMPVQVAQDGRFIIAFNRDAPVSAQIKAVGENGQSITRSITIAPRRWNIEHVDLPRRKTTSSAAFKKRRAPELAAIGAARSRNSKSDGWRQDFIWPVKGRISGRFGSQRIFQGSPGGYHTGIDIAGGHGARIVAPADGVAVLVTDSPFSLEGNLVIMDHGMGLNSAFLHLSKIVIKQGDGIRQGQYIGNVGATGSARGAHLHWSMKWGAARLDPILLTGPM